jgi:PAS domain S-box-containing protein
MEQRPLGKVTRKIYYVLATFIALTVLVSAYLNFHLVRTERDIVATNERSAAGIAWVGLIEDVAGEADAPGNDIFTSGDLAGETARQEAASEKFRKVMQESPSDISKDAHLLKELRDVDDAMSVMRRETGEIFRFYGLRQIDSAAASMAKMDRHYANVRRELSDLKLLLRARQLAEFRRQSQHDELLAREQAVSVGLIALLVFGLVAYGRYLDRREALASRERERYVAELDARSNELVHNQQLLTEAERVAQLGAWEWNLATGQVWWSDELYRLFGVEVGSVEPSLETSMAFVAPSDYGRVAATLAQTVADSTTLEHEYEVVLPNGEKRRHLSTAGTDIDAAGQPVRMFGVTQDITERKRAEQTLGESEERFNSFMKNAPIFAFIKDAESRYVWINESFETFFGIPLSGIKGKTDFDLFDRLTAGTNLANDRAVLETGTEVDSSERVTTAGGIERSWLTIKFPLRLSSGERHIGGLAVDVTDREALDKQLDSAKRISSLGRLAANMSHEINNVLMGILPFAELIERRAKDDQKLQNAATHITRSVDRGRRITQEILDFTRGSQPVQRSFDSRKWLAGMVPELRSVLGEGIDLEVELPEEGVFIRGDALQLQQVMTNLAVNARDAMEGSGRLSIKGTHTSPEDRLPFNVASHPDGTLHLTVKDSGNGIPADIINHIFEPLFTTKRSGNGLGLAISHQVITIHGGDIHVESTPGVGTAFHILLPCTPHPPLGDRTEEREKEAAVKRVVLVEDDVSVGEGIVALLEEDGVQVHWVQRGGEAEPAIASFQPDVLLLDVGLPDVNGFDLYRRLRTRFPTLPTIFSTGHGEQSLVDQFDDAPVSYLMKPYDSGTLLRAIGTAMRK